MASTLTTVFFIFLQLSSQNIGCLADCSNEQGSNLWDIIKQIFSKASELLMYGIKIIGYVVDAFCCIYAGLQKVWAVGYAVINTIYETVRGTSFGDFLKYSFQPVAFAVAIVKGLPFLLSFVGFGPGGIIAASIAAWFQSWWFGGTIAGVTGAVFSALQSVGAAGLGAAGMAVVTFLSGISVWVYECLF